MNPIDLLIHGGHVITVDAQWTEYPDGAIAVRGRDIVDVGPAADLAARYEPANRIDASGQFIFPGLVNTHTHLFQNFLKGLGEGIFVHKWIDTVTRPAVNSMTDDDFYLSAKAGCLDAIRSGTTTLVEYMYPTPNRGMEDAIFQGMLDSGIRGLIGRGLADIAASEGYILRGAWYPELTEAIEPAMDDCARLLKMVQARSEGRLGFCLAPVFMRALTPDLMRATREFANAHGVLITMHTVENLRDEEVMQERHGMGAIRWLAENNLLGPDFLGVHCVNLNEEGIRLFAEYNVKVSYNPVCHMYIGLGVSPVAELLQQGVVVALATDGAASNNAQDMLEVTKAGVLLQRVAHRKPDILSGRDGLRMATIDGARALGLEQSIGSIEPGKRADLVIVDFRHLKSGPYYDPINTLVFSSDPRVVDTVVIDGQVVLRDGCFVHHDEDAIIREAVAAGHRLAQRTYGPDVLKHATAVRPAG